MRAYSCIVKLSAAQAGTVASVILVGHVICFPQPTPQRWWWAPKPLLAEGLTQALSLCLVGPQRLHDLLRRTGQHHSHLLVDPGKEMRRLTTLIDVTPRYASLNVSVIDTADMAEALRGPYIQDDEVCQLEAIATNDVEWQAVIEQTESPDRDALVFVRSCVKCVGVHGGASIHRGPSIAH